MRKEPEVVTVTLKKHNGMGLSIVAAKVGPTAGWGRSGESGEGMLSKAASAGSRMLGALQLRFAVRDRWCRER